jgi:hypothetical protein
MQKDSLTSTCASDPDVRCDKMYRLNAPKDPTVRSYCDREKKNKTYVKVDFSLSPKLSPIEYLPVKSRHEKS